jgi:hypothetical protein
MKSFALSQPVPTGAAYGMLAPQKHDDASKTQIDLQRPVVVTGRWKTR